MQWVRIDMGRAVVVSLLAIYGQTNYESRSKGYSVYVGNDENMDPGHGNEVCVDHSGTDTTLPTSGVWADCPKPIYGRYVYYVHTPQGDNPTERIQLCEIQVRSQACGVCPTHSQSPVASPSSSHCKCNAGWTGSDGEVCTKCVAGKYKSSSGSNNKDELYQAALDIIRSEGKASTSFLQRKLQIGYNRAARIIDMMEADGIVSKANHVGKRDVL